MSRISIAVLLVVLSIFFTSGYNAGCQMVEQKPDGKIDWTQGTVQAVGIGNPPEKDFSRHVAQAKALTSAKVVAQCNLLEIVKTIRIDSGNKIKDILRQDAAMMTNIESVVRNARLVKQEYLSDGTAKVTIRINLHGGFAQLILPLDIRQIEPIKPVGPTEPVQNAPLSLPADHFAQAARVSRPSSPVFTGLVVDAGGLAINPAMTIKILDENGRDVYGPAYVSREFAVGRGMVKYVDNITTAQSDPRVMDNPLTVKGLETRGAGCSDIIISNADASKIRSSSEHLLFLKKCGVIVVIN